VLQFSKHKRGFRAGRRIPKRRRAQPRGSPRSSDQQLLNGQLELLDLGLELAALIGGDAACDDWAGYTAGAAQGRLGGDKHVGHVLQGGQQKLL
jgi:hypothetical protein